MKQFVTTFLLAAMAFFSFAFLPDEDRRKAKLKQLSGTYADAQPYSYGKAWGQRVFTFDHGRWTLVFTLAQDPKMEQPVFTFRTHGHYEVQNPSTVVANAYNALFYEEQKFLTLKTSDLQLIHAFGFAACGLKPFVEQDVSVTGCAAWKSVAACPGDYDLLSLDDQGLLYFGARPADNDMCSPDKRPQKLTPPVTKQ